ncbi:hypothetical protein E2976_17575 [Paracoccus yeei]|uniref:hypothetical protein n=1 Tax=Paracoccus yeei TaxID=147645 RepID=UPI003BF826CE
MSKAAKLKARRKALKARAAGVSGKGHISLAPGLWDHGADGQANRRGLVVEERGEIDAKTGKMQNPNGVTGARRVDLLEFWHNRGTISDDGYTAAKALRSAFEATMKGKPALPDNDRVQSSPKPDQAIDIQIDRVSRFHAVMRHVAERDRTIVSACVLHGQHPSRVYGALRTREGLAHLRDALDRLADCISMRKIA